MAGESILVMGGSGFVGRHLVNQLVDADYRVIVPTRRRERARHLIMLPTVEVVEADVNDPAVLAGLAQRAVVVINLVGILNETRCQTFADAHVESARRVAGACQRSGVRRLLQMSALNADPQGPSRYLRSKGEAEEVIAASGLDWTIFRPSVIFGREDSFLNLFAKLEQLLPVIALAAPNARFQPVYVRDVARCFVRALFDDTTIAHRYPLCGPRVYTLQELVRYVGKLIGAQRPIMPLGPTLSKLSAAVLEHLPGKIMSRDNLASMEQDSVCEEGFPAAFGIVPAPLEAIAPTYIGPAATRSAFDEYRARSGR